MTDLRRVDGVVLKELLQLTMLKDLKDIDRVEDYIRVIHQNLKTIYSDRKQFIVFEVICGVMTALIGNNRTYEIIHNPQLQFNQNDFPIQSECITEYLSLMKSLLNYINDKELAILQFTFNYKEFIQSFLLYYLNKDNIKDDWINNILIITDSLEIADSEIPQTIGYLMIHSDDNHKNLKELLNRFIDYYSSQTNYKKDIDSLVIPKETKDLNQFLITIDDLLRKIKSNYKDKTARDYLISSSNVQGLICKKCQYQNTLGEISILYSHENSSDSKLYFLYNQGIDETKIGKKHSLLNLDIDYIMEENTILKLNNTELNKSNERLRKENQSLKTSNTSILLTNLRMKKDINDMQMFLVINNYLNYINSRIRFQPRTTEENKALGLLQKNITVIKNNINRKLTIPKDYVNKLKEYLNELLTSIGDDSSEEFTSLIKNLIVNLNNEDLCLYLRLIHIHPYISCDYYKMMSK